MDIASLVFEIDSTQAVAAEKHLDKLAKTSERVEASARKVKTASEQAGIGINASASATGRATKSATQHAAAAGVVERAMRSSLLTRSESIKLLLRNAQVQAKLAADEARDAKRTASEVAKAASLSAKATAAAERERSAAFRQSQAIQAEIMRERVALARQAEREESAAARAAASASMKADRDAAASATAAERERVAAWRQSQRIQAEIMRERVSLARAAEREEAAGAKAAAAERAEADRAAAAATADLERRIFALKSAIDPAYAAQSRLDAEMREAAALYRMGAISSSDYAKRVSQLDAEMASAARGQDTFNGVMVRGVGSSKNLTYAGLNLSRQLADIGVQGSQLNANWGMIFIQQAPQIVDIFQNLKAEGIGVSAALKGMYAQAAPLLAILAPIAVAAAAVGSVFALSAQQINSENKGLINSFGLTKDQLEDVKKKTITMGDVAVGTFNAVKGALLEAFGPQLKAAGNAITKFLDELAANTVKEAKAIVGAFVGAYEAVVATWKMLPSAFGDATISAANLALTGLEKLINGAIGLINPLIEGLNDRFKLAIPTLSQVEIGKLSNSYAGAMERTAKAGAEAFARGNAAGASMVEKGLAAVNRETLKAYEARVRKEAGDAKAAKAKADELTAYEKAVKASQEYERSLTEEIQTMGMSTEQLKRREIAMKAAAAPTEELARAIRVLGANWEYQTGVMNAFDAQNKAVTSAANDNIKSMAQTIGEVHLDTAFDGMIFALEKAMDQAYSVADAVDGIAYSIRGNDWLGAFAGLLRAINEVKKGFEAAKASGDKLSMINAIGGAAMGVGSAIGGSTGGAITGAASGAMTGAQIGSIIPGVGTAVGSVVGGLIGGISSLFGSSKAKKRAKAEAEAQRLAEEQARLQAVANERRALEIQLMELQGDAAGALAAARSDELAKMDASNRALKEQTWALQDAAAAKAKADALAAEAAQKAATIATQRHDLEIQLLEAMGKTDDAAKIRLADERATVDESLRGLFDQIQAERELTRARDAATAAVEAAARAEAERAAAAASFQASMQSDAANLVAKAQQDLRAAYDAQVASIRAGRDQMAGYAQSFREFRLGLSGAAASGEDFYAIAAKARLGDTAAMGQLVGAAQAADASALSGASTQLEYLREQTKIRAAVQAAEDTATRQVSIADKQLAALEAQVSGLITVNDSVLSVASAVAALKSALKVQDMAFGGAMANPNREWGANPDVNKLLARTTGYAGDFGAGGWQAWIEAQDEATKAKGRAVLMAQGQSYRAGFAVGGVFTSPTDFRMGDQLGQMAEAGPEAIMPLVQTGGGLGVRAVGADNAELKAEIRDLKETLNGALIAIAKNTGEGARIARRWDGDGLPPEREVAA